MDKIFSRASVRQFKDKKIHEEKLERILRAGMQAPTAGNQQAWKFIVVTDKEVLAKLAKVHPYSGFVKDAPSAIVVVGDGDNAKYENYLDIDCAICTENIMLEAHHLDLGSCMIGIAPLEDRISYVRECLALNDSDRPFTIIVLGEPLATVDVKSRFDVSKITYIK